VSGTFERTQSIEKARLLEKRFPDPDMRPPLFGLALGVKDIFHVDGFETRCGSRLPASLFEGAEASSVKRLKDAGAIIFGKTVTAEFAGSEPGPTRNPHNFAHTPGGSSSGSAAGVASGYFHLALGTQTSGSVIRPAAYCGVVGFKPSFNRVPTDGVIPFSDSTDHVGIFVPDTSLVNIVMRVLVDDWKTTKWRPHLGVPDGPYLKQASPRALSHFEEAVKQIEQNRFTVRRIPAFDDIERINRCHRRLIIGEITRVHRNWYQSYPELYRPRTVEYFVKGKHISESDLPELREKRLELRNRIQDHMEEYQIEAWITPSATGSAPRGLSSTGNPIMNIPWTNAGLPVASIPSGTDESGLPYGLQIVGKFMEDEKTAAVAEELEKIIGKKDRRP